MLPTPVKHTGQGSDLMGHLGEDNTYTESWSDWRTKFREFSLPTLRETKHTDVSYTEKFGMALVGNMVVRIL